MNYKRFLIFIAAIILLIVGVVFLSKDIMTPYVPFKLAIEKNGEYVQVIGSLDKNVTVKHFGDSFSFTMKEKKGETVLNVTYKGTKPLNFKHAEQIVALGRYNNKTAIFVADKLLVKCPSKYKKKGE